MGKKVLILSSTPRKGGNSQILCQEFQKGAEAAGNQVELVVMRDKKINYCTGCGACNTTHKCAQDDDMAAILDKMVEADVIVMATPVYFYTMDAQMKTLIDRTAPRYKEIENKDFYYIVTAADNNIDNMERTIEGFRGFAEDCLPGSQDKGIVYGVGAWEKGEICDTPALKQAYEMGKTV